MKASLPATEISPPAMPAPGSIFLSELTRTTDWKTGDGRVLKLKDMETDHLWSVLGYMRWFAPQIAELDGRPGGPLTAYLTSRPIWQAIANELIRRGLITSPGQAIWRLRRDGRLAWESAGSDH